MTEEYYPMPMFATAVVSDLDAAADWYRAAGFRRIFTQAIMIHMRRQKYQDLLLVNRGAPASGTDPGLTVTFAAHDDDLDAIAASLRAHGGGQVAGPIARPWNTDELEVTDADGHKIMFTKVRDRQRTQAQMLADSGGRLD
jgi:uncharacterized glyoxalase superfamily protein PhnB